jgi:heat shock protein HslJ
MKTRHLRSQILIRSLASLLSPSAPALAFCSLVWLAACGPREGAEPVEPTVPAEPPAVPAQPSGEEAGQQGRLSLADLAGEWQLTHFGRGEAVGEGIDITLAFDGDRISGGSGCNRYSGGVAAGEAPGTLSVDQPLASTRMACPDPLMEAEQRYLQALASVRTFSFVAGKLVLTWSDGDAGGSLLFARRGEAASGE